MAISVFCETCGKLSPVTANPGGEGACSSCGSVLHVPNGYDVFISYTTANLAQAEQVATGLKSAAISYWLAPSRINLGESFLTDIDDALASAKVIVLILSSASVQSPWVLRETTEAISSKLPVLPLKIEEFDLPREWRRLLSHNQYADAFHQPFEVYVNDVVTRVQAELLKFAVRTQALPDRSPTADASSLVEAPPLMGVDPGASPYVGPRPFPKRLADKFFGRQHEARALLNDINESQIVLVYAPSGAGKSSLLNTLICQTLEEQGFEVLLGVRVGGALPVDVKASDIRNIYSFSSIYSIDGAATPNPQCRLDAFLKSFARTPGTRGRIVIFDQFEELFTNHPERFEDREGFFEELFAALANDHKLQVIFAMRQEYLADIDPFLVRRPENLRIERFSLKRLGMAGALEAITRPAERYATFAPGLAEEIVRQLNTIRVPGFDGVVVEKRGEFIEMVHLQIVCERLWNNLPKGITQIEKAHVECAAGEGKTFNDFVANALNAFYEDTVKKVAESTLTHEHGEYSKELIQLGCMKFVTTSSTRTQVQRVHGRTGRLPDWVVEQLEQAHLLRAEQRGGVQWYELSHDLLAEPVARQIDRKVSALLFAADLLDKVLERVLDERGRMLSGYFEEHREIVKECQPFYSQAGLFADEAEFVFRASLVSGQDMQEWSRRLGADFPQTRLAVLREALTEAPATVRHHAATMLGLENIPELENELLRLVLSDQDDAVRRAAAASLVQLDKLALFAALTGKLNDPETRPYALRALVFIRVVADRRIQATGFEANYIQLSGSYRRKIRRQAWSLRLADVQAILPYIFIPSALFAAAAAATFKWLPGAFNFALCQASASAGMGIFHGITAGVIWGGFIPLGLILYRVVFANERAPASFGRPFAAIIAGGLTGGLVGLAITVMIANVFETTSLATMGWVASGDRSSLQFWWELFVQTRFGWVYAISGTGLGVAIALITNGLRASGEWSEFLGRQTRLTGFKQTVAVVRNIVRLAWRYAWPLPIALTIAGILAFSVQRPSSTVSQKKASVLYRALGTAADCGTEAFGGFFSVVGLGLGLVIMRHGVQVDPRKDRV